MEWSYSGSKVFFQCQRFWYFQTSVANSSPRAKDPLRREAFLLSKLQSIEAWRGSVVDLVIEKQIIDPLNKRGRFSQFDIWNYAERIFEEQLDFARAFRSREDGMTVTKGGDQYAALFNLEYGLGICDEDLDQAWKDIESALRNLLDNDELLSYLVKADYLVAQRKLYLKDEDFAVTAIPDVIAFYESAPPVIIDWKVHTLGQREYWLQLACYALTLTRITPHADFGRFSPDQYAATDLELAEAQLLLPDIRWYTLTENDMDAVESYIHSTSVAMISAMGDDGNDVLRPLEFPPTSNPIKCETCQFKQMCGADTLWVK